MSRNLHSMADSSLIGLLRRHLWRIRNALIINVRVPLQRELNFVLTPVEMSERKERLALVTIQTVGP